MKTCDAFHKCEQIGLRVPHMHIRLIPGEFPHFFESSYDRDLLIQNQKQRVHRNFVVKKKKVNLWIDFVEHRRRDKPLKKKPRSDGLDNTNHDFSDDEYEEEPESPQRNRPVVEDLDTSTVWGKAQHAKATKKQQDWDIAEGPREKVDRSVYNQRVPYRTYFMQPLDISTELVFDDTLEPVQTEEFPEGVQHSNKVVREGGTFRQPNSRFTRSHEMPAQTKLHVPLLSSEHGGRRFRLLLTGTGMSRSGEEVCLKTYSEPFEVVSDIGTVKRASKRRTAEERSAYARERELKKHRAAQPQ
jgi:hypothetical protein